MTLNEQIMKLQTYKMYEDEDIIYVERDDVLKLLGQQSSEDCISILNRIMEYTYGMMTAEKIGLQHFIKSMMDDLPPVTQKPQPCEDAISRQAAIDVVRKWFDKIQLNADICLDGIKSLPSLPQPYTESEDKE